MSGPPPGWVPSTIILNPFSQAFVDQKNDLLAPYLMGAFVDLFLQGILTVQTANYLTFRDSSGESRRRFIIIVIILTILCLLKSAQNIYMVWDLLITNYVNPDMASLLSILSWSHYTTSFATAIIATYVQSFFIYRYWLLTKRIWVCILILLGMCVSFIGSVLVIVYLPKLNVQVVKMWSDVHFIAAVVVDTAITIGTSYHLYTQKSAIRSTMDMINRLIRMTWQSALPPAVFVILNLIVLEHNNLSLAHIALNMTAAKLYAISLMYTLNLRNELRGERLTSHERSTGTNNKSFVPGQVSYRGQITGQRTRDHIRSRPMDGVHVETHISTSGGMGHAVELRDFVHGSEKGGVSETPSDGWEEEKKYRA